MERACGGSTLSGEPSGSCIALPEVACNLVGVPLHAHTGLLWATAAEFIKAVSAEEVSDNLQMALQLAFPDCRFAR